MVENGRDIDGLISEWHRTFTLAGLVATLPWLIGPIITNRYLKSFLMPSKGHRTRSGHVMTVGAKSGTFESIDSSIQSSLITVSVARENVQTSFKKYSSVPFREHV